MKFGFFLLILVFSTLFLTGCQYTEDSSCLVCSKSWQDYTDRAIAGLNVSGNTTINNNYYLNSTVKIFNITSVQTVSGTSTTSNLTLLKKYDSKTWNISEVSGTAPIDFRVNITGVTSFNKILLREKYLGGQGHIINIYIWDYTTSTWESYADFTDQPILVASEIGILDSSNHLQGGKVQLRFLHSSGGNPNHRLYIDYIFIVSDSSVSGNVNHDSFSGRNNGCVNHPWACVNDTNQLNKINNLNSTKLTTNIFNSNITGYHTKTQYWNNLTNKLLGYQKVTDWQTNISNYYTKTQSNNNYLKISDWIVNITQYNTQTQDTNKFVSRSDWTTHDNYPSACSGLTNTVQGVGDTLTCINPNKNPVRWINYTTSAYTSTSATVYTKMLQLYAPLEASSTYLINCNFITYGSSANNGTQLRVNTTGTPTKVTLTFQSQASATTIQSLAGVSTSSNAFASTGSAGTNIRATTTLKGIIQTSGTASRILFETKAESSSASSETYDIGSYCEYIKVA